jgi:hypothetical protein
LDTQVYGTFTGYSRRSLVPASQKNSQTARYTAPYV